MFVQVLPEHLHCTTEVVVLQGNEATLIKRPWMDVNEVSQLLGCSKSKAYKIIAKLNKELKDGGYIYIHGKISRKYLMERVYG